MTWEEDLERLFGRKPDLMVTIDPASMPEGKLRPARDEGEMGWPQSLGTRVQEMAYGWPFTKALALTAGAMISAYLGTAWPMTGALLVIMFTVFQEGHRRDQQDRKPTVLIRLQGVTNSVPASAVANLEVHFIEAGEYAPTGPSSMVMLQTVTVAHVGDASAMLAIRAVAVSDDRTRSEVPAAWITPQGPVDFLPVGVGSSGRLQVAMFFPGTSLVDALVGTILLYIHNVKRQPRVDLILCAHAGSGRLDEREGHA